MSNSPITPPVADAGKPSTGVQMPPFVLVNCDFVKTGGMDRANYALARYLAERGAPVHAVAHSAAADLLANPNVKFHRVAKPARSYFLGEPLLGLAGRRWARKLEPLGGRAIVNGGNCSWSDANWVHYVHAAFTPQNRLGWARRLKHAFSHQIFLRRERSALSRARVVIANSHRTRQDLIQHLRVPADRIHVIYYGSDAERFHPVTPGQRALMRQKLGWDSQRPTAIFIGALGDRRKGFDIVFDAWQELCGDRNWDVNLVVIGSGAELPAWRRRAAASGLGARIEFLGFRRDVPDLLAASDVMVAPTRYEAYGLGVHEALCRGLPAIVSASAGVAERYPDALRELLAPDGVTAAEFAARLRHWRQRGEDYRTPLEEFSRQLRQYSWDDMADAITRLVLCTSRAAPSRFGPASAVSKPPALPQSPAMQN